MNANPKTVTTSRTLWEAHQEACKEAYDEVCDMLWEDHDEASSNPKTIAIDRLREMGACEDALEFLSNCFGDSVVITEEYALACAEYISWEWASENLLNEDQRRLYVEACCPHWKTREKAYEEAHTLHREAYIEACAPHWRAYAEALDKSRKTYVKAYNKHRKAYVKACAKAFVAAYYTK